MQKPIFTVLLLALATGCGGGKQEAAPEGVGWEELSDRELTPAGRRVLAAGGDDWTHGESSNFIYHVQAPGDMAGLADEVEFAYRRSGYYLGSPGSKRKAHVFVVSPELWKKVLHGVDYRGDALAMQFENDIFLSRAEDAADRLVRMCHEMVHYRLWTRYGHDVPVWLDEGLAGCLGWKIAGEQRRRQGMELVRQRPPVDPDALMTVWELTRVTAYPGAAEAPGFYRQAEELIRAIARKIGYDKLSGFVEALAGDRRAWNEYLRERFSFSDYDFRWLDERVVNVNETGAEGP